MHLHKVEGSDKVLKEIKADFFSLNQKVTVHSAAIKQLDIQLCQILAHLNHRQIIDLPSDMLQVLRVKLLNTWLVLLAVVKSFVMKHIKVFLLILAK